MPELMPAARTARESIFSVMSRLAAQHGAVNLGQGFPADPPPAFLLEAARGAVGHFDQYSPPAGLPALREALGADLHVNPQDIVVTCGATEALAALALSLYGPGDEVLMLEPVYDVYLPQARLAGATPVTVPMTLDDGGWAVDVNAVQAAVTGRTRALLLNTPHNPTGKVLSAAEQRDLVALARQHDLWIISDEVYDELSFTDEPVGLRSLAPERTFTVGSAGKRLEATGWRVGWVACPAGLAPQVVGVRQLASFCAPTPLQVAGAQALPRARQEGFYAQLREKYRVRKEWMVSGLRALGVTVHEPQGTYFLTAQHPAWDALSLVREGVAVIPGEAFYDQHDCPPGLFRVAFCKSQEDLEEALARLSRLA
ncbi:aminotransferase class I/II-fold pyridoxal phosphate-dependent enzyme [Deinococcus cavernae]|uniref:Aminotransferase class I/II-fold pyridoxal phosphate-dependent enzyme n=2 Tax=Deinococcus cavernae TaxID=2320857 RepID=A0A418VAY1_9DEIO|nr:aminotransferase class I/II-fold pyridoxal phosphate-dependent enzyme [Deinococcus cavernae]